MKQSLIETATWIDLTHELSEETPTWEGTCGFHHIQFTEEGSDFLRYKIDTFAGIGTHIDAPVHRFAGKKTIELIPLQNLIAPCIVIDISKQAHAEYRVNLDDINAFEKVYGKIPSGSFVIFYTGWDKYWQQPEKYQNDLQFPTISGEVAEFLLTRHIVGLGIDTLSPDCPANGYPVHEIILGAGCYLVENIAYANKLPPTGSYAFTIPIKIRNGSEAPIRLFAMVSK